MLSRIFFARTTIILKLLVIGLWSQGCLSAQQVPIEKSPYDNRQYAGIYLDNGLRVLLVSDPTAEKAAAALNVEVGSYNDPESRKGLAHFLEHMLFLGTDKFPDPSEFSSYISAHGGMQNAYTSNTNTQYYFDVLPAYLPGALDRFAQFFIAPQFTADLVGRERNAVDSEYKLHLQEDGWRINEVKGVTGNPEHPIVRFSIGSLETLGLNDKKQTVRDDLIQFYKDYYSAERMVLVIVAPQSIVDLQKLVFEYFSSIPKHPVKNNKIPVLAYTQKETSKQIAVHTLGDYQELSISFTLPSQREKYETKSIYYIIHMLQQSGQGSLYQALKSKNYITGIYAYLEETTNLQDMLNIGFSLTPEGKKNTDYIVNALFNYLDFLRKLGPQEEIFTELRMAGDRNFKFAEKQLPINYAGDLPDQVQRYPLAKVLTARYFTKETRFDAQDIQQLLTYMRPQNMRVMFLNKDVKGTLHEPYFKVNYSVQDLTPQQIEDWTATNKKLQFSLPENNKFMPVDFNVLNIANAPNQQTVPQLILDKDGIKLWHKQDHTFGLPTVNLRFILAAPNIQNTPKRLLLQGLMCSALTDRLSNLDSQFALAGVAYSIAPTPMGLDLGVSMFSSQQQNVMQELIAYLQKYQIDPNRFKAYIDDTKRSLLNFKQLPPYAQAIQIMDAIIDNPSWLPSDLLAEIDKITIPEVEQFTQEFLAQVQIQSLIHGNMTSADAMKLVEAIGNQLQIVKTERSVDYLPKLITLKDNEKYYYQFNPEHADATIVSYYQAPTQTDKTIAVNAILIDMLHNKTFDQLRTTEQLGYVVQFAVMRTRQQTGIIFIIESDHKQPQFLNNRLDAFLATYRELLPKTSNEEFEVYKSSLRAKLLQKPTSLTEETARYWGKISDGSLRFDFNEIIAQQISNITLADVSEYFNSIWFDPKLARQIMVSSRGGKTPLAGAKAIENIAKFKAKSIFEN